MKFVVKVSYWSWDGSRRISETDGEYDTIEHAREAADALENGCNPEGNTYWAEEKRETVDAHAIVERIRELLAEAISRSDSGAERHEVIGPVASALTLLEELESQ